jgi:uncharacterized protein DUF4926
MIQELDSVVLTCEKPAQGLKSGDIGTVVHRYREGQAYEVEFVTGEGRTVAVLTLSAGEVRPMQGKEILHVRALSAA